MSEFDETYNDDVVECPYCGDKYQPEAEDYSEDERITQCSECNKFYHLHQSFSVTHQTRPDCEINGGNHNYEPVNLRNGRSHPFCTVCGDCKPHGKE